MKFRNTHIVIALAALILMMVASPSLAKKKRNTPQRVVAGRVLSPEKQRRYSYFFLEAVRQQNAGKYSAAFDLLSHCLRIDPEAPEAYYLQSMYYSALKQDSLALKCLERAASLAPDNSTYLERLAESYLNGKGFDKAILAYEQLADRHRDRTDVLNVLTNLYQQVKNYDGMLDCIRRIEQMEGSSEEMTLSKMRVYEMKGDSKSAYRVLASLCNEHPNDLSYKVMAGNWLMQHGKRKEAYKMFKAAQEIDSNNDYVQTSLYDYYKEVGEKEAADGLLERILINPNTEPKSKITLMQGVIQDNEAHGGDSTQVLNLFRRILGKNPTDSTMVELEVAYMSLKKMPEDSINGGLCRLLAMQPENAPARLQLIQSYWLKEKWDSVIALSKPGTEYNTDELVFSYFLGMAYFQKKDNDQALEAFRQAVRRTNSKSDPTLVSDCYSIMGDIYHEKGMTEAAFAAYDSCLQWKSDHVGCLNNYAYYLSVENRNLHKAEEMSYKTIKAEPKNSTFLDTYAWILFQQERYTEARIYIEQAVKSDTDSIQSPVILEHAGDIYYKTNDTGKALDYWNRSLKAGNESVVLPKKIKLKQYIKENE